MSDLLPGNAQRIKLVPIDWAHAYAALARRTAMAHAFLISGKVDDAGEALNAATQVMDTVEHRPFMINCGEPDVRSVP